MTRMLTRRRFAASVAAGSAAILLAACQPKVVEVTKVVEKQVEKVVKETVVVAGTPQVVEKVVEKQITVAAQPTAKKPATITCIWRNNPNEKRTMEEAWKRYKEIKPLVTVNYLVVPSGNEGEQKLLSLFAGGTPPEIFASVFMNGLVDYYYRGILTDMIPYIERDKYDQKDFFPVALQTFTFGGKQMGLPRGCTGTCLFLNLDMFQKEGIEVPPDNCEDKSWTWDKMVEIARKFTKDTNNDGKLDQYGLVFNDFNYNQFALLSGKSIFAEDHFKAGISLKSNLRDETIIRAYQKGADLIWKDKVAPSREASDALAALGPGAVFLSGRVAMTGYISGPSQVKDAPFKVGVCSFPRTDANVQQRIMTWTGPLCMGKNCGEPEEGWQCLSWLCAPEGQKFLAPGATVGTARLSLFDWWAGQTVVDPKRMLNVLNQSYKYALESPNVRTVSWSELSQVLGSGTDPLYLGKQSAVEILPPLADKVDAKMKEIYDKNKFVAESLIPGFKG